jgi:hypothetical protein
MALAMPGNMGSRKAVDIHCNLGVVLQKEWINNTIWVHVQFGVGVNPLQPFVFKICEFEDVVNF